VELARKTRRIVKRLPLGRRLWRFVYSMRKHGAFRATSAMAFDGFLSLIPLLSISGWLVHKLGYADLVMSRLLEDAGDSYAVDLLRMSDRAMLTIAPLGVLFFLWLSSNGVSTAMGVCEVMFEATVRSWWRRRAIAMAWVVACLALLGLGTAVFFGLSRLLGPSVWRVVASLVFVPLVILFVNAFFRTAIRRPRGMRRHYWQGAVLTVVLWLGISFAFWVYVRQAVSYPLFYGGLATIAMVLVWIWFLSFAVLVGGELNAQLEGVREFPPSTAFDPRGRRPS
jgi:membrane protein